MREASAQQGYSYRVQDLVYRAVSVAKFETLLGAYVSAGRYYEFGNSVRDGVGNLRAYYNDVMAKCPNTRWVLAGYSQGAMVVAEAVKTFVADKVIYIGLFGDPELSLPEGAGLWPAACRGSNISQYRVYAPYCKTHSGVFGERNPYQYGDLRGKYGLWCAKDDYICGSSKNPLKNSGHFNYANVGVAWMADLVMARLPRKRSLLRTAVSSRVYAVLPFDEYYATPGEQVILDASGSFSSGGEIAQYEWNVGNGWFIGEKQLTIDAVDGLEIRLRATDANGASAETSARIVTESESDAPLPAPAVILNKDTAGIVYVSANDAPEKAKYLLVRLNGFDLGYTEVDMRMRIGELKYGGDEELSFAWMDANYNVGDDMVINSQEVLLDENIRPSMDDILNGGSVATGVSLGDYWCLAVIGGSIIIVLLITHKKDARRCGGRPREGP